MRKTLSFILVLISLNMVVAKNELPKVGGIVKINNQPNTRSQLYPNPAVDATFIKNSSSTRIKNISVLSMVGSSMINKEISDTNSNQEINVAKLPTGRYFVKVSYIDGNQEILNLIKL